MQMLLTATIIRTLKNSAVLDKEGRDNFWFIPGDTPATAAGELYIDCVGELK